MTLPAGLVFRIVFWALVAGVMGGLSGDPLVSVAVLVIGVSLAYIDYRREQKMRRDWRLWREQLNRRRQDRSRRAGSEQRQAP